SSTPALEAFSGSVQYLIIYDTQLINTEEFLGINALSSRARIFLSERFNNKTNLPSYDLQTPLKPSPRKYVRWCM
ncbi:hypothetical protein V5O48_006336, partial [Marasmius crinis-equi]